MKTRQISFKAFFSTLALILLIALSVQAALAGGADPEPPTFDSRICGRPGNVTQAQTIRWTDLFGTADPTTHIGSHYPPSTAVTIIGRDFWGCWVSVQSASANGWVPINALNARGVLDLPILADNSNGCVINNGQVSCPHDGGTSSGNVARWTNIFSAPNSASVTNVTIPPNGSVVIVGETGGWAQITSEYGNGYIPKNALK